MDRRVKYTRRVLNESLIRHLEQKDLKKITVKELCEEADVNRSTYYAHFTDPFDQLTKLKSEVLGDLTEYTRAIDTGNCPAAERPYRVLCALLQFVETRKPLFRILLNKSGNRDLQLDILNLLGEKAFSGRTETALSKEEREYLLLYASNGCFGMFYHWLMEDSSISSDQLAHMMADFTRTVRI